jgi:hypothetical protein
MADELRALPPAGKFGPPLLLAATRRTLIAQRLTHRPVAGLPADHDALPEAGNRLLQPPQLLVGEGLVGVLSSSAVLLWITL